MKLVYSFSYRNVSRETFFVKQLDFILEIILNFY